MRNTGDPAKSLSRSEQSNRRVRRAAPHSATSMTQSTKSGRRSGEDTNAKMCKWQRLRIASRPQPLRGSPQPREPGTFSVSKRPWTLSRCLLCFIVRSELQHPPRIHARTHTHTPHTRTHGVGTGDQAGPREWGSEGRTREERRAADRGSRLPGRGRLNKSGGREQHVSVSAFRFSKVVASRRESGREAEWVGRREKRSVHAYPSVSGEVDRDDRDEAKGLRNQPTLKPR